MPAGREVYLGRSCGREGKRVDAVDRDLKSVRIRVVARGGRRDSQCTVDGADGIPASGASGITAGPK
jgi:hypothetical protein